MGIPVNPISRGPRTTLFGVCRARLNGDGQSVLDRACVGLGPAANGCQFVAARTASAAKALIQLDSPHREGLPLWGTHETTIACGDVTTCSTAKQLQLCGQHFLQFRWHTES